MSGNLLDEIRMKKQLKKCETLEKHGIDYINAQKEKEKKEKEIAMAEVDGGNDFLSQLRKVQLKKK